MPTAQPDLQKALSSVLLKEITKEEEAEVRNEFALGRAENEISMNTFMAMMDHLSDSDTEVHARKLSEKKRLLAEISEKIHIVDRNLLGMEPMESITSTSTTSSNYKDSTIESDYKNFLVDPDEDFESAYGPHQMKILALISMGRTRSILHKFVMSNKNLLSKFILTGDDKTMIMMQGIYQKEPNVLYKPLNDDQINANYTKLSCSLMKEGLIGGIVIFEDPSHSDEETYDPELEDLCELSLQKNVMVLNNPTTALMITNTIRTALKFGKGELIPSFFFTLKHPSMAVTDSKAVDDKKEDSDIQSQLDQVNRRLAETIEENHNLTVALSNAELKAFENHNELISIVEGIMDVDSKEASIILRQLESRSRISRASNRDSPLTVTDDIEKDHPTPLAMYPTVEAFLGFEKSNAETKDEIVSPKIEENSFRNEAPVTDDIGRETVTPMPSAPMYPAVQVFLGPESEKNNAETIDEIYSPKSEENKSDIPPNGSEDVDGSEVATKSDTGVDAKDEITEKVELDPNVPSVENLTTEHTRTVTYGIENPETKLLDGSGVLNFEDMVSAITSEDEFEEDIDTQSVVYDFARPGTAPAASRTLASMFSEHFQVQKEGEVSPRLATANKPQRGNMRGVRNSNNSNLTKSTRSLASASSRREQALENLKKRFQEFTTNT